MSGATSTRTPSHAIPRRPAVRLTPQEVHAAFLSLATQYPPILSLIQAAELAGLKPSTLKRKVSDEEFADCVRRGKPLRFWRDRFVIHLFAN